MSKCHELLREKEIYESESEKEKKREKKSGTKSSRTRALLLLSRTDFCLNSR